MPSKTFTPYHAQFIAHELTLAGKTGSLDSIGQALFDAQVDLNPHQIEAAVFALAHPSQKGVLLADEVGLGKTIEAGLVLAQHWAARKRRLCVVCPAHLRMQWATELSEKFHLPCRVVDAVAYRELKRQGKDPLDPGAIVILSYAYASRLAEALRVVPYDLVVLDEAHKLRNAYKNGERQDNAPRKGGVAIRHAFALRRKILLSATPIQNNLMELYGLGWIMDEHLFGSQAEFKHRYGDKPSGKALEDLKERLTGTCHRTLRSQVQEFVKYTRRKAITQDFTSTTAESRLREAVLDYMRRDDTYGLPKRCRPMLAMLLCHTLASSPEALAATLSTVKGRLEKIRDGLPMEERDVLPADLGKDVELDAEEWEEWLDEKETQTDRPDGPRIAGEIRLLEGLIADAKGIGISSKTRALMAALKTGFDQMARMGAPRKALVFTESRKTQAMLTEFLRRGGYKAACFNGDNTGPEADSILAKWRAARQGDDQVTGSRAVDIRSALVAHFKDEAEILIATEAGAEGVNLQFCSLVVNFDLPWNPQRIEQRIGRCHRYGQKHDVTVINFLDSGNTADRRIHELLSSKFNLFDGLFGSSDEVIGAVESGLDFEKRVLEIFLSRRRPEEIQATFDQLQHEMDEIIQKRMAKARILAMEHLDGEVNDRLKLRQAEASQALDRMGSKFWRLTRWGLGESSCQWHESEYAFELPTPPTPNILSGHYRLRSCIEDPSRPAHLHRLQAPLGQWLISKAIGKMLPPSSVRFQLSGHGERLSALEPEKSKRGWMRVEKLDVDSDAKEQFLLVSAVREDGSSLDPEVAIRMFDLDGVESKEKGEGAAAYADMQGPLSKAADQLRAGTLMRAAQAGNQRFQEARDRIRRWADEKIAGAERDLDEIKDAIIAMERESELATTPESLEEAQTRIRALEKRRRQARERIYDAEDEVKIERDDLIQKLKQHGEQKSRTHFLFEIAWEIA